MAYADKGFSWRNCFASCQNTSQEHRTKDEQEMDEVKLQLKKIKVFYRCSRVKLIDLKQEIRLLNSLIDGEPSSFYKRRLEKFRRAHEVTESEVEKYKGQIDLMESRIEELKTPSFLRSKASRSVENNIPVDYSLLKF